MVLPGPIGEAIEAGRDRDSQAVVVTGGTAVPDTVGLDESTAEAGGARLSTLRDETFTIEEARQEPFSLFNEGNVSGENIDLDPNIDVPDLDIGLDLPSSGLVGLVVVGIVVLVFLWLIRPFAAVAAGVSS